MLQKETLAQLLRNVAAMKAMRLVSAKLKGELRLGTHGCLFLRQLTN